MIFIRPSLLRARQIELFRAALRDIQADPGLINMALDVDYDGPRIAVRRYQLP